MRFISLLILLLVSPAMTGGQDTLTLAKRPNSEQVALARETIQSAAQAPTTLADGGYAIIDI